MENSIEHSRAVAAYLALEGDFGEAEALAQASTAKFDAWELEALMAFAAFKTGGAERALGILARSPYARHSGARALHARLEQFFRAPESRVEPPATGWGSPDDQDALGLLSEILSLDARPKDALALAQRMPPGHRQSNALGLGHLAAFRLRFDRARPGGLGGDAQGCEFHLLSSRRHFEASLAAFAGNAPGALGLALSAFFQKDWTTYTAQMAFLRPQLKNQVG